jgi:hypothetical protein
VTRTIRPAIADEHRAARIDAFVGQYAPSGLDLLG